jgi:hypothetical protein
MRDVINVYCLNDFHDAGVNKRWLTILSSWIFLRRYQFKNNNWISYNRNPIKHIGDIKPIKDRNFVKYLFSFSYILLVGASICAENPYVRIIYVANSCLCNFCLEQNLHMWHHLGDFFY